MTFILDTSSFVVELVIHPSSVIVTLVTTEVATASVETSPTSPSASTTTCVRGGSYETYRDRQTDTYGKTERGDRAKRQKEPTEQTDRKSRQSRQTERADRISKQTGRHNRHTRIQAMALTIYDNAHRTPSPYDTTPIQKLVVNVGADVNTGWVIKNCLCLSMYKIRNFKSLA